MESKLQIQANAIGNDRRASQEGVQYRLRSGGAVQPTDNKPQITQSTNTVASSIQ